MKRVLFWIWVCSLSAFIIDWAAVGLMLLRGDYDIMAGAVVGGIFVVLLLVSGVGYKLCNGKCPHCGKYLFERDEFCPHCGEKLLEQY